MSDIEKGPLTTRKHQNLQSGSAGEKRVVVIGSGRFGSAYAQGLRDSFIQIPGKELTLARTNVVHFSAKKFMALNPPDMIDELRGSEFIVYCGTRLPKYASRLAKVMKEARKLSSESMEFVDFSNPDPVFEKDDVTGAIDMHLALTKNSSKSGMTGVGGLEEEKDEDGENKYNPEKPVSTSSWKVWKVTEVGSLDVACTEGTRRGLVYGAGIEEGEVPRIKMPGLHWESAPREKQDLFGEAHHRIMERAEIDRWYDGNVMGFAVFCFTAFYAITRYSEDVNGSEPNEQIVMYLLDKAFAWTGLWMMAVSPFAGNMLALGALYNRYFTLPLADKFVTILSSVLMIIPTIFFSLSWILWIVMRNIFFRFRGSSSRLYQSQYDKDGFPNTAGTQAKLHSMLVDMVTMKGETGNVGFMYALIHSWLGFIVADVAYKGYWFVPNGRLGWRFELSMTTGVLSTTFLLCVALRSMFGNASWIRLKPLYAYMSPIGMWFAVVHVMAFGAKGWDTLFNKNYHNGQMSITFVSSMFPACILLTHHFMGVFGTKKRVSDKVLWKHSLIHMATQDFEKYASNASIKKGGVQ